MSRAQVLELASATPTEVGTRRDNALGGGLKNPQRPRVDHPFGHADRLDLQPFAGERARDEHRPTLVISEGLPSIDQFFRREFKWQGNATRTRPAPCGERETLKLPRHLSESRKEALEVEQT